MSNQGPGSKKIVIVDDDSLLQVFLSAIVSKLGHHSIAAMDATMAFSAIQKERPDLVILDMMMPGGGGVKVFERMRMNSHTVNIPIIVYSGKRQDEVIAAFCVSSEMSALTNIRILQKPLNPGKLMGEIEHVLECGVAGAVPPDIELEAAPAAEEREWVVCRNDVNDGTLYTASEVRGFEEYPNLWVFKAGLADWVTPCMLPEFS